MEGRKRALDEDPDSFHVGGLIRVQLWDQSIQHHLKKKLKKF
jgi:hypothetical protein